MGTEKLIGEIRTEAGPGLASRIRSQGKRAFARLERGLGDYAEKVSGSSQRPGQRRLRALLAVPKGRPDHHFSGVISGSDGAALRPRSREPDLRSPRWSAQMGTGRGRAVAPWMASTYFAAGAAQMTHLMINPAFG